MSTGRTTAVRPRQATVRVYVDAPIANGMMTACLFALTAASVFVYWEHIATLVALVVGIAGITHVSGVACLGRRGTDAFLQQAFKAWSTRAGIALSRWIAAHKCSAARRQRSLLASSGNHARVRRLVDGVGAGGPVSNAMEASRAVAVSSCPCSGLLLAGYKVAGADDPTRNSLCVDVTVFAAFRNSGSCAPRCNDAV